MDNKIETRITISDFKKQMLQNLNSQGIYIKNLNIKFCSGVPEDYILMDYEKETEMETLVRVAKEVVDEKVEIELKKWREEN